MALKKSLELREQSCTFWKGFRPVTAIFSASHFKDISRCLRRHVSSSVCRLHLCPQLCLCYASVLKAQDANILYLTVAPKSCFGTKWVNENWAVRNWREISVARTIISRDPIFLENNQIPSIQKCWHKDGISPESKLVCAKKHRWRHISTCTHSTQIAPFVYLSSSI